MPQTSKVLDEHAVRVEFPWADVPAIKSADILSKWLSVHIDSRESCGATREGFYGGFFACFE